MNLSSMVSKALETFRRVEGPKRRGPKFAKLAQAFEDEMHGPGVTEAVILESLGPPDIARQGLAVYVFDHKKAGRNRDEWYFIFENGQLSNSGFNRRGINSFPGDEPLTPRPG